MSRSNYAALRGRIGGFATHAKHGNNTTGPARSAFLAKFEDEVDPDRVLPEHQRQERALAARRAHMARLAYLSAKVRSSKAGPASDKRGQKW